MSGVLRTKTVRKFPQFHEATLQTSFERAKERRLEAHEELIFVHGVVLVGSNGGDRSNCNEEQIKFI